MCTSTWHILPWRNITAWKACCSGTKPVRRIQTWVLDTRFNSFCRVGYLPYHASIVYHYSVSLKNMLAMSLSVVGLCAFRLSFLIVRRFPRERQATFHNSIPAMLRISRHTLVIKCYTGAHMCYFQLCCSVMFVETHAWHTVPHRLMCVHIPAALLCYCSRQCCTYVWMFLLRCSVTAVELKPNDAALHHALYASVSIFSSDPAELVCVSIYVFIYGGLMCKWVTDMSRPEFWCQPFSSVLYIHSNNICTMDAALTVPCFIWGFDGVILCKVCDHKAWLHVKARWFQKGAYRTFKTQNLSVLFENHQTHTFVLMECTVMV